MQPGEVRSRGFEFEAGTTVNRRHDFVAAYAYMDARITRMTIPSYVGKRQGGVPYNQLSLWADINDLFGVRGLQAVTVMGAMVGDEVRNW